MFRKKTKLGGVTVLDDNESKRAELLSGATVGGRGGGGMSTQQHHQTLEQLEAEALKEARSGKESTARALKLATEARETGVETAAKLQAQTAQLERMGDEIEVVHDYLDKSERIIDKMTKPKIVRMFQRKKPMGRGLDKAKTSKKERAARDDLRDAGVDALDIERMQEGGAATPAVTLDDEEHHQQQKRSLFGRSKPDKHQPGVREIDNDYSQYSEGVAQAMREQDEDLDQIGDMLGDMKALANAMNNELKVQDGLIDEVQKKTNITRERTQANAKKVKQIK